MRFLSRVLVSNVRTELSQLTTKMQQIVQLSCTTLWASGRVLNSDALHIKSFLNPKGSSSYSRWLHSSCNTSRQAKLLNPCITKCDSRSFHFQHDLQVNNSRCRKESSLLGHRFPNCQDIQSVAVHTTSFRNVKLLEEPLTLKNSVSNSDVDFYFLSTESPFHCQIRFLQSRAKKRVNRTFSSQGIPPKQNGGKKIEEKDLKEQSEEHNLDEQKLTLYQRFKKTYKEHGKVLVAVHLLTSSVWLGSFYLAARCGFDIVPLLESWNLSDRMISPFRSGGLGDVALAYLMYKLATPARYTVTIGGTNLAIRYLRKGGKMQPVAKEDTLREMYKEGKANLKTRSIHTRSKIRGMHMRMPRRRKRSSQDRKKS